MTNVEALKALYVALGGETSGVADAVTIVDIRYYNIMGQESMTPFDGINIMVVRYKDGSFKSMKVLK